MINIAICDDEPVFQRKMKKLIQEHLKSRQIECKIDCFDSGEQLIEKAKSTLDYEIVFLDVNMKEMNGIETANRIRTLSENVYIIFVTGFISYALDGYKVNATRYLLKSEESLGRSMKECLDTLVEKMNYKERWEEFQFRSGKVKLPLDRILYIESRLHKTIFYVLDDGIKEYYMYDKLDHVQKRLNGGNFYRVHQSFVVNMRYVKGVKRYKAILAEGSEISISKRYYKEIEKEYIRLKGEI